MSKKPFRDTKFAKFVREKVGPIAGDVLNIVGDLTGIEAIEKVGDLINSRKEESAEMMALHMEFEKYKLEWELEMQRLQTEELRLVIEDTQSARDREVKFMQANGGKRDWVQGGLVIFNMTTLMLMLAFLAFQTVPKDNERIFDMLLGGVVVSGAQSIYQYYFGSSRGSKEKNQLLIQKDAKD